MIDAGEKQDMARYGLVIFDLDGTLLDTTEGIINSVRYTIEQCNLPNLPEETLKTFIGPPIQDSFRKAYNIADTDKLQELATIFRNRYKDKDLYKAKPYSNIYQACEELQAAGILLAVATYKREDYAVNLLCHFGFDKYMTAMYGADHENKLKKADIIQKCLNLLGKPGAGGHAVMVGDTENDRLGAERAGIDFIGVTYGFGFQDKSELGLPGCIGAADSTKELSKLILDVPEWRGS